MPPLASGRENGFRTHSAWLGDVGLGAIVFLLVFAGLLAVGQAEATASGFNPSSPFVLCALAGFEQKNIMWYLQDTIAQMLRISEHEPYEAG